MYVTRVALIALIFVSPVWGADKVDVDIFACASERVSKKYQSQQSSGFYDYRQLIAEIVSELKTVTRFKINREEYWIEIEGEGTLDNALLRNVYIDQDVGGDGPIATQDAPRIVIFDGEELIIKNYSSGLVRTERFICNKSNYWRNLVEKSTQQRWNKPSS